MSHVSARGKDPAESALLPVMVRTCAFDIYRMFEYTVSQVTNMYYANNTQSFHI